MTNVSVDRVPSGEYPFHKLLTRTIAHPTVGGPSSSGCDPEDLTGGASPWDRQRLNILNHNSG